jgi:hypothetical protein
LRPELDTIPLTNLDLAQLLIGKIESRKESKFKDPYAYNPNAGDGEADISVNTSTANADENTKPTFGTTTPLHSFKFVLGAPVKDADGGDASILLKKSRYFPHVGFIRTKYCSSVPSSE